MDNLNTEELAKALGNLTIPQLVALTKKLEADWGVSAKPQVSTTVSTPGMDDSKAAEQTEFTVSLVSFPADKKMAIVKMVRDQLGLGLLESKNLAESVPKVLKEGVSKEDADLLKAKFTEAGGVIEVK